MIFKIPGPPKGKGRPRFTKQGRAYTPKDTHDYERLVSQAYKDAGGIIFGENKPVYVQITACFPIAKSDTKKVRAAKLKGDMPCMMKPDIDNIIKIILDGLNGVAFVDDKQVNCTHACKQWDKLGDGCVYVSVTDAPGDGGCVV